MRLLYQSMTPVEHLTNYADALKKHAKKSCSPDTQVDFKGVQESFPRFSINELAILLKNQGHP